MNSKIVEFMGRDVEKISFKEKKIRVYIFNEKGVKRERQNMEKTIIGEKKQS